MSIEGVEGVGASDFGKSMNPQPFFLMSQEENHSFTFVSHAIEATCVIFFFSPELAKSLDMVSYNCQSVTS